MTVPTHDPLREALADLSDHGQEDALDRLDAARRNARAALAAAPQAEAPTDNLPITLTYRNWRGEIGTRRVLNRGAGSGGAGPSREKAQRLGNHSVSSASFW